MKKFLLPLVLLAGAMIFQGGCTNAGKIVVLGLRIDLTGIERTADGTTTATWHIDNPNVAPYLLSTTNHKVFLNGTLVGTITDNTPMAIPTQSAASKTGKLVVAGPEAERILAAAIGHGPVSYRLETNLVVVLYGDSTEKGSLTGSGSVAVTAK